MSNNLDSKISIHTFMISRQIKGTVWQELKNKFYTEAKNNKNILAVYETNKRIEYYKYAPKGIIVYLTWAGSKGCTKYHRIEIRVNPRRLIGDDTFIGVFEISQKNLDLLDSQLRAILCELGFYNFGRYLAEGLESFILSRADICINFYLDEIDTFIDAVRKCFVPYGFKKYKHKNGKIPQSGVYLQSKNMNVQIYNKLAQMLEDDYEYSKEELDKAQNLARFELQLHRPKIYNWIKSRKIPCDLENGLSGMLVALVYAAHWVLHKYSVRIFGEFPYYSRDYIYAHINDTTYSELAQDILLDYLEQMRRNHDAEKIAKKWEEDYTHIKMQNLMGKIEANVIPIFNKRFNRQYTPVLPSVPKMIHKNIKDNRRYLDELLGLNASINGITYSYTL